MNYLSKCSPAKSEISEGCQMPLEQILVGTLSQRQDSNQKLHAWSLMMKKILYT